MNISERKRDLQMETLRLGLRGDVISGKSEVLKNAKLCSRKPSSVPSPDTDNRYTNLGIKLDEKAIMNAYNTTHMLALSDTLS
jgi:hypothetical protein